MKTFQNIFILIAFAFLGFSTSFMLPKEEPVIQYVDKEVIKEIKVMPQYQMFEVTAYTPGFESTGKNPMDSEFRITASGLRVIDHYTLACPESLDFGTKVYIPAFESVFTCMDRGSAITEGKLDVYMEDLEYALMFGRQHLEVFILP